MTTRTPSTQIYGSPAYAVSALPAYRGGAPAWTPADVTVSASITWEVLDASGTMYGDVAHTTPITANNDPIGAIPTLRGATIQHRATEFWLPRNSNMTYAPVLKTTDATYSRVVACVADSLKEMVPGGIFDDAAQNIYLSEDAFMFAIRIKHHIDAASAFGELVFLGYDFASSSGPGFLVGDSTYTKYKVGPRSGAFTGTGVERVATDVWSTVVMLVTGSGTSLYLNDPVTPVYTNAGLTPLQYTGRSIGFGTLNASQAISFRRFIVGSNFNAAEAPIAGVMSWLEG